MATAISYTHPVLGNGGDFTDGSFAMSIDMARTTRDEFQIKGNFELVNSRLQELVDQNKAVYQLRIYCQKTYFRDSYRFRTEGFDVGIPSGQLLNRVEVRPLLIAREDIEEYVPVDPHPAYEGEMFYVKEGQLLALGSKGKFIADKDFDPLKAPGKSIVSISKAEFSQGQFRVDFSGETIEILVSQEDWKKFQSVKGMIPSAIHSMLAVPVIAEAVRLIADEEERGEYADLKWCARLEHLLELKKLGDKGPLHAAEALLGQPLGRGLRQLDEKLYRDS